MEPHSKWLTSNITERFTNPLSDFRVAFHPRPFKIDNFYKIACRAAIDIANQAKPLCLALSGGADSEFILDVFHDLRIPITPIIIDSPYYRLETAYAFHKIRQYDLKPVVLRPTDSILRAVFANKIAKPFNGTGIGSIPVMIATMIAQKREALLVHGQHFLNDDDDNFDPTVLDSPEFDWYQDGLYPEHSQGFFAYCPDLMYALVKEIREDEHMSEFKARVYGTPFRPKIRPMFPSGLFSITNVDIKRTHYLPNRDEFLTMMESWNV